MKTVKILSETGRRLVNGSAGTCLRLEEELPSRFEEDVRASISALAQVVIQAPGLSFRCICHPVNPIKTRCESGFCLLCTSHGPCCVSTSHQVRKMRVHWCVPSFSGGIWVSSWEEASHVQVLSEDFTTRQRLSLSLRLLAWQGLREKEV